MTLKRCIDVFLSALLLVLCGPILAVAAAAVWLESGSPILFRQERVGRNFAPFFILKLRTMRFDPAGASITVNGDSRVTRVGRFLRAAKIDELPQLWNVLRGDMSLIGPRPEVPLYVERFQDRYKSILRVRPGITDLASLRYRNEEAILAQSPNPLAAYESEILPAKLDLADEYIRERTDLMDLVILLRTIFITIYPAAAPASQRRQPPVSIRNVRQP